MNHTKQIQDNFIASYGDAAAEMLAARFIWERMECFEAWMSRQGFSDSSLAWWINKQRIQVYYELQSHERNEEPFQEEERKPPRKSGPDWLPAFFVVERREEFSAWLEGLGVDPGDAMSWAERARGRRLAVSRVLRDWGRDSMDFNALTQALQKFDERRERRLQALSARQ